MPGPAGRLPDITSFNPHNDPHYRDFADNDTSSGSLRAASKLHNCIAAGTKFAPMPPGSRIYTLNLKFILLLKGETGQSGAKRNGVKEKRENIKPLNYFIIPQLLYLLKECLNFHFMNQNPVHRLNFTKAWKTEKKPHFYI